MCITDHSAIEHRSNQRRNAYSLATTIIVPQPILAVGKCEKTTRSRSRPTPCHCVLETSQPVVCKQITARASPCFQTFNKQTQKVSFRTTDTFATCLLVQANYSSHALPTRSKPAYQHTAICFRIFAENLKIRRTVA